MGRERECAFPPVNHSVLRSKPDFDGASSQGLASACSRCQTRHKCLSPRSGQVRRIHSTHGTKHEFPRGLDLRRIDSGSIIKGVKRESTVPETLRSKSDFGQLTEKNRQWSSGGREFEREFPPPPNVRSRRWTSVRLKPDVPRPVLTSRSANSGSCLPLGARRSARKLPSRRF
jgi:hypothetical protein